MPCSALDALGKRDPLPKPPQLTVGKLRFPGKRDDTRGRYWQFAATAQPFAVPDQAGAAVAHHLSTLFPPVRPRGSYLEFRYLDAQPEDRVSVAATLLATLLYDDESRRGALQLLAEEGPHLNSLWRSAALAPGELVGQGGELVDLALDGISRAPGGYLPGDAALRLCALGPTTSLVGAA